MSEAAHVKWADFIFRRYLRGILRKSFHSVNLVGPAPEVDENLPLLLVTNHSTWWDGFFAYLLNDALFHRVIHVMMLEEQLARFPFFRLIGAFGILPGHPKSVIETLRYAARVLNNRHNLLCMFPQGVLEPFGRRPLNFKRGVERILHFHGGDVNLVNAGIRCEFLGNRKPEVFVLFGDARRISASQFSGAATLERDEEKLLETLEAEIARGNVGRPLRSSNRLWRPG